MVAPFEGKKDATSINGMHAIDGDTELEMVLSGQKPITEGGIELEATARSPPYKPLKVARKRVDPRPKEEDMRGHRATSAPIVLHHSARTGFSRPQFFKTDLDGHG
jgi:hypothetical protein